MRRTPARRREPAGRSGGSAAWGVRSAPGIRRRRAVLPSRDRSRTAWAAWARAEAGEAARRTRARTVGRPGAGRSIYCPPMAEHDTSDTRRLSDAALAHVVRRLARRDDAPWLHAEIARRMAERLAIVKLQPSRIVDWWSLDRKSTRLNSSHANISYAVFCL